MKELATIVMTKEEAESCVRQIRDTSHKMRELLLDLYDRDGWKALGYESFTDCIKQEFAGGMAYMYRQLAAASMEKRLPIGEIGDNKESHLRPLLTILDNDPMRMDAWYLAHAMSSDPTAKVYEGAAYSVLMLGMEDELPTLVTRMQAGIVSPQSAYAISKIASGEGVPDELKHVCSYITDPALAPMLRSICYNNTDTWQEILATGYIPSATGDQIPIAEANAQSLKSYLYVAGDEHKAAAIERNREHWDMVNAAMQKIIAEAREARSCSPALSSALDEYDALTNKEVVDIEQV